MSGMGVAIRRNRGHTHEQLAKLAQACDAPSVIRTVQVGILK